MSVSVGAFSFVATRSDYDNDLVNVMVLHRTGRMKRIMGIVHAFHSPACSPFDASMFVSWLADWSSTRKASPFRGMREAIDAMWQCDPEATAVLLALGRPWSEDGFAQ